MRDLKKIPSSLVPDLSGRAFRRRRRTILPLLTMDPGGLPRAALLSYGEVRARSADRLTVAVTTGSRTEANLIRRGAATLLVLETGHAVSIQARAGRGRICRSRPDRTLFPLRVVGVRSDRAPASEGDPALACGARFAGGALEALFSPDVYAELGAL
jgi:hypothetical protein